MIAKKIHLNLCGTLLSPRNVTYFLNCPLNQTKSYIKPNCPIQFLHAFSVLKCMKPACINAKWQRGLERVLMTIMSLNSFNNFDKFNSISVAEIMTKIILTK